MFFFSCISAEYMSVISSPRYGNIVENLHNIASDSCTVGLKTLCLVFSV